jgi:hypothetical protein
VCRTALAICGLLFADFLSGTGRAVVTRELTIFVQEKKEFFVKVD